MTILSYNGNHHTRKLEGQSLTWNGTCVEIWLEPISPLNTLGPEPIWICLQCEACIPFQMPFFVSNDEEETTGTRRIYESPLTKSKSVAPESYCNFKHVILKNISWYSLGPHSSALLPRHFNKKIRLIDIFILQNSLKVNAKDFIDDKSTFVPRMVKAAIILIEIHWWQTLIQ